MRVMRWVVRRFIGDVIKIQLDSTLEICRTVTHTEEKSSLAGSPMPKTDNFVQFRVQKVPLWEGEGGGGVSHHWLGQKLGSMAESVTGIAVKMADKWAVDWSQQ